MAARGACQVPATCKRIKTDTNLIVSYAMLGVTPRNSMRLNGRILE